MNNPIYAKTSPGGEYLPTLAMSYPIGGTFDELSIVDLSFKVGGLAVVSIILSFMCNVFNILAYALLD